MLELSADEMYQNALAQLSRIELDVVQLVDKLDVIPAEPDPIEVRQDYERLLLRVREATGVHDSLGRLVVWTDKDVPRATRDDITLQLNRAVVIQALAYITATHYLRRSPGALSRRHIRPLEDARSLLLTGQLWRERIDSGFARRTIIRLKRWIVGREPMGGADLDCRVDSAMHGQHAVAALAHIRWKSLSQPQHREALRASELLELGQRHLQERRLGYHKRSFMPLHEVLNACARLELVLGVENSSSDIYFAKAVLASVRVACYMSAAEHFSRTPDRRKDQDRCVHEVHEELARARRMLAESYQHWLWDVVRRIKRRPAQPPFQITITYRQLRRVVEEFTRLIRKRRLPYLIDRRAARDAGLAGHRRKLFTLSRTALGSERFQRAAAKRRSARKAA